MHTRNRRGSLGLTLVETLVSTTVAAVCVGVCVPFATGFSRSAALGGTANLLLSDVLLARSEARKRGVPAVLCKSASGSECADSGGWEQGWIVFVDTDGDAQRDAAEVLLHHAQPLPPGLRVAGNLTVSRYISFHPAGGTRTTSGAFQAGTVTLCWTELPDARQVIISATGRPRIHKATLAACP
jgi:type IV fimbrial biogenesis protein FimT